MALGVRALVFALGGSLLIACNDHRAGTATLGQPLASGVEPRPPNTTFAAPAASEVTSAALSASALTSAASAEGADGVRADPRRGALDEAAQLSPSCATDGHSWRIQVRPRNRRAQTLEAIERVLGAEDAECEPSGWVTLYASSETLQRVFGTHIELSCVEGMGNSMHAPALIASIVPDDYLPRGLAVHARRLQMDNDPKSVLIAESVDCATLFR